MVMMTIAFTYLGSNFKTSLVWESNRDFSRFSEEWLRAAVVGFGAVTMCVNETSHVRRAG